VNEERHAGQRVDDGQQGDEGFDVHGRCRWRAENLL
jgi:hypothetical protein